MAVSEQRPHVAATCLLLYFLSGALTHPDPRQREALIKLEASMQMGGQIVLTDAEQRLNSFLMKKKQEELWRADFPPALHFFKAKPLIRSSPIFSVLQKMPKGVFNVLPPILKHSYVLFALILLTQHKQVVKSVVGQSQILAQMILQKVIISQSQAQ